MDVIQERDQNNTVTASITRTGNNTVANSYQFDAMGNRTDWRDSIALKSGSSSYNTLNQLTQTNLYDLAPNSFAPTYTGTLNYGYDNDGNTTSSQLGASNTLYAYDEENRLISITSTSNGQPSSKSEFVYDGMSRLRISRYYSNINGTLTQQNEKRRVYDGMDIVQERDQNNTVTASITRTGNIGGLLARTSNAGSVFYGYDGSGNVTTLTNSAGAEVGSYTYDAFGNTVATSGSAASENPYRFSTKESIGGLYSYGLRFYSPVVLSATTEPSLSAIRQTKAR